MRSDLWGPHAFAWGARSQAERLLKYGWHKDDPDGRDRIFAAAQTLAAAFPNTVDLSGSPFEAPVLDQRPLSSCSAHAISAMFHFINAKEERKPLLPSRLFIYYNERKMENTVATDAGAKIRNGIKSVAKIGVCDESDWPYDTAKFADAPPESCYRSALEHRAIEYLRIRGDRRELKACLAAGYPFVFGMSIYSNFFTPEIAKSGAAPMPGEADQLLGGHAVMAVGYDETTKTFLVRNSCGDTWGRKGYFTLPYAFMESRHLCDDFWTIRAVA
ncbi:MAG: C1 family peptidase [Candidatus Baltobacteraceae bacterium]